MWIRSQDDEVLLNMGRIIALKHHKWFGNAEDHGPTHAIVAFVNSSENFDFELGRYHNEKRVTEILEEIEDEIESEGCTVYYMPLE